MGRPFFYRRGKHMFHRIRLFAVSAVLLTSLMASTTAFCEKPPEEETQTRVLVRVNDEPITEEAVRRRIRSMRGEVTEENVGPGTWQRLTEAAVESEMLDLLLLQAAKKEGYRVSPEAVDRDLARTREVLGEAGYQAMLEKRGVGEEQFRRYLADRLLIARYRESLFKKVELSRVELKEYYKGHPQRFALPERYRLHIMVFSNPDEASAVMARIKEGESFATLAEAHAARGGKASRTRPMPVEAIPEEMREAVIAAPVGQVVQQEGPDGSYLIKVLEKIDREKRSFEEAKADVRKHLREIREQRVLNDWYEAQAAAATIEHLGR
jgi:parvulin-like peptidyl-prolyl isomerase